MFSIHSIEVQISDIIPTPNLKKNPPTPRTVHNSILPTVLVKPTPTPEINPT